MKKKIDIDAILAPIPGDNPAGEDLRYNPVYEEIKEARRSDDALNRGDWQHEIKRSDWDKVITVSVNALTKKTKDLQIAAWLTEALINTEAFEGLAAGLQILTGLMVKYWEQLYPLIEDGDLDFRAAPVEFLNEKLWASVKQLPITDSRATPGYSWLKWEESRAVGYESDARNKYGDVDENKKKKRDDLLAEGKLSAEDFDAAAAKASKDYYKSLTENLDICRKVFKQLEETVDEKFGNQAPRLAEFGNAIEDCYKISIRFLKEKGGNEPVPAAETSVAPGLVPGPIDGGQAPALRDTTKEDVSTPLIAVSPVPANKYKESASYEKVLWEEALRVMNTSGITQALKLLLEASNSAPSVREKNRYRLLIAKLCLKAESPDLARPIAEELHALIEELHLERWESPLWIAEVIEALYQCLTKGEATDDDIGRAKMLLKRLCTTDVTAAVEYRL